MESKQGLKKSSSETFLTVNGLDNLNINSHNTKFEILNTVIPNKFKDNLHSIKSSSTSSLFIDFTMDNPQVSEIVRCLATALYHYIKTNESKGAPKGNGFFVYSEEFSPLDKELDLKSIPSLATIHNFLKKIFSKQQLSAETAVMSLSYIDRLITLTNIHLHPTNWRKITLGAIILASKVWEDLAVWNADFLDMFPLLDVDDLNRLERQFLNSIRYMVSLKPCVYTKYFLELKSLSNKNDFPTISKDKVKLIKMKSLKIDKEFQINMPMRSKSVDMSLEKDTSSNIHRYRQKKKKNKITNNNNDNFKNSNT